MQWAYCVRNKKAQIGVFNYAGIQVKFRKKMILTIYNAKRKVQSKFTPNQTTNERRPSSCTRAHPQCRLLPLICHWSHAMPWLSWTPHNQTMPHFFLPHMAADRRELEQIKRRTVRRKILLGRILKATTAKLDKTKTSDGAADQAKQRKSKICDDDEDVPGKYLNMKIVMTIGRRAASELSNYLPVVKQPPDSSG